VSVFSSPCVLHVPHISAFIYVLLLYQLKISSILPSLPLRQRDELQERSCSSKCLDEVKQRSSPSALNMSLCFLSISAALRLSGPPGPVGYWIFRPDVSVQSLAFMFSFQKVASVYRDCEFLTPSSHMLGFHCFISFFPHGSTVLGETTAPHVGETSGILSRNVYV
jgi:hypothetical protein